MLLKNAFAKIWLYFLTIPKLGWKNVLYVIWYRTSLKIGLRKLWFPKSVFPSNRDFFLPISNPIKCAEDEQLILCTNADKIIRGYLNLYSFHWKKIGNPPEWFRNTFNGQLYPNSDFHWTRLPDFEPSFGDIKNLWEISRFNWVTALSMAYAATANTIYLNTLNAWLKDWVEKNPLNIGPNWKCGQEASVRVFNLLNAAFILHQHSKPTIALIELIDAHLRRIEPNIRYAIAQDNNHGTSEAAGLFIGGAWLLMVDSMSSYKKYRYTRFVRKGRYWLENRVNKLVADDGTFSQYSVNYHRVLLDTLSFVEFWRRETKQFEFSEQFYNKASAALNWLYQMTDKSSGHAPNMGSNDGAMLLQLHTHIYTDLRPSLQLAGFLFTNTLLFPDEFNQPLRWLRLVTKRLNTNINTSKVFSRTSLILPSGFLIIRAESSWAMLRLPKFSFRPAHNDVFHFDLWYNGQNIICDAGSFSYNPPPEQVFIDLKSVLFHNTVSFDGREQMPKISRFLLGKWLKPDFIGELIKINQRIWEWEGQYTDNFKNTHRRSISTDGITWIIHDTLSGNFHQAVIGYNLNSDGIVLNAGTCTLPEAEISFEGDISKLTLDEAFVSKHYFELRKIYRLNIHVSKSGTYTTIIKLK